MPTTLIVGLDGTESGDRAIAYAKTLASRINDCNLLLVYVIEWSPYTFQTPEENSQRHKRREEEISMAKDRIVNPAVSSLTESGFSASGIVRHGDVADLLNTVAVEEGAEQIIVARSSESGFVKRVFGTSAVNLVMHASVPVTVVG